MRFRRSRGPRFAAAVLALAALVLVLLLLPARRAPKPAGPVAAPFVTGRVTKETPAVSFGAEAFRDPEVAGFCLVLEGTGSTIEGGPDGAPPARVTLTVQGAGRSLTVRADLRRGARRLCIPCIGMGGFVPQTLRVDWPESALSPRVASVEPLRATSGEPITAELGAVLAFLPSSWRDPDYEYFRWSDVPSVVVFDTSSYDVQSRMFKRLSFFVEKRGYAGSIADFDAIADLHGFNAHDYRAEDLARFFASAARDAVPLLHEERRLEEILLRAGVLRTEAGEIRAGAGGVISISRSSSAALRLRFLTHEALHGLFFTSASFRAAVASVWERSSRDLVEYIRLYLSRPDWSYDLGNSYLLQNEFMAYFLQYPEDLLEPELVERGSAWIRENYRDRSAWLDRFLRERRAELPATYRALEAALWKELGVRGGELIRLSVAGTG